MAWPDIAIAAIVVLGAFGGFKRGFVRELAGVVALAFAVAAAFFYPGLWDGWLHDRLHLAPDIAHVAGMVLYAVAAYAIVLALASALSAVAKLPLIGTVNALLGGVAGLVKTAVFVWAVLYVALFFPLSHDLRGELHRSRLVALLQQPNERLDSALRANVPPFVRPFAESMLANHRV